MNKTKIEWVKNPDGTQGYTWNPITGCLNNCSYCYARKLANGRLKPLYLANRSIGVLGGRYGTPGQAYSDPFYPRFWDERLDDPFLTDRNISIKRHTRGQRRTPRGIFVCDMGELFGDWLPREWQEEIHMLITLNPQHRFYLLTKQPQNLPLWSPFPDNCWVGVTATDYPSFANALHYLMMIEAKLTYVSLEPLLERIFTDEKQLQCSGIGWLIIGAQTNPYKPPKIEWVEEIVKSADKAGIPVFLKNNLYSLLGLGNGKSICHNNEVGTLRQEMPK